QRYDCVECASSAKADVLLLQECGFTADDVEIKTAGNRLGLPHIACLVYSQAAHTESGRAGLAVLSRYPITFTRRRLFTNPVGTVPLDAIARLHRFNKGTLTVVVDTPLGAVNVMNLHSFPLRYYGLTPDAEEA